MSSRFLSDDFLRLKAWCEDNQRVRAWSQIAQRGHAVIVRRYFLRANLDDGRGQLGRSWVEHPHLQARWLCRRGLRTEYGGESNRQ